MTQAHIKVENLPEIESRRDAADVQRLVAEIRYLHELISEWRWTCSYYTIASDTKHPGWRRHTDALTKVRDTLKADNHYPGLVAGLTHILEGDEWDGARWVYPLKKPTAEEGREVAMAFIHDEATPENLRRLLEGVHSMRSWVSFWGDRDEMSRKSLVGQLLAECDNLLEGRDALDDGRGRNR